MRGKTDFSQVALVPSISMITLLKNKWPTSKASLSSYTLLYLLAICDSQKFGTFGAVLFSRNKNAAPALAPDHILVTSARVITMDLFPFSKYATLPPFKKTSDLTRQLY